MAVGGFFFDAKRAAIRQKTGVGFFEDYLLRSEVNDYRRLRLVVNFVLGLLFCSCLYYLGWKRLNFADFHHIYGVLFKWFMILSIVFTFVLSPMFRCAMFCVLIGSLGKNGQAPLSLLVMNNLSEGPVENIISNYHRTAEIILCHLELQAKIASNRVAMFTGPLEGVLESQLNTGLRILRKAVNFIRRSIAPFLSDISGKDTAEDNKLNQRDHQLSLVAQRKAIESELNEEEIDSEVKTEDLEKITETKPDWTTFKTKNARKITSRISKRCNDIFVKGIDKCRDTFSSIKEKCYDALPFFLEFFVCPSLNLQSACDSLNRRLQSIKICQKHLEESRMSNNMERELDDVVKLTDAVEKEMKINLHMIAVDMPRIESVFKISELKVFIKAGVVYVKKKEEKTTIEHCTYFHAITTAAKEIVQGLFIFCVYSIFRDAVRMINNYTTDVEFNNRFINELFWKIDEYRRNKGQVAMLRMTNTEMATWNLMKVFSMPTNAELKAAKKPFINWVITAIIASSLIVIDHYLYSFLNSVVQSSHTSIEQMGTSTAQIEVEGKGVVANFVRGMVQVNRTVEIDQTLTNAHCLVPPQKPNLEHRIKWIILPLTLSLILQVVFSFVVKRVIINYFFPFMFPRRDRVRLIYLYNKLLFLRSKHRTEARARIRFTVARWKINEEHDEGGWISSRSWFKINILDRIFKTGQCLMCQIHIRPASLYFCAECPASYCKYCLAEMNEQCYACQFENGLVNTENSQVKEVEEKDQDAREEPLDYNVTIY